MIHIPTDDYAGKYLREYEWARYPLWMKALHSLGQVYSIIVPPDAEQFADASFYQGRINWDIYALNARAVILRIGQGIWIDSEFERNYAEAKARGILIGGYWFFDGRYSPQQQRDKILQATAGKSFELEVFFDWERSYNGAHEGIGNVVALMQITEDYIICKDIGTYTGYYWFLDNTNPTTHASQYNYLKTKPLWIAWYAAASAVRIPAPWLEWTHWQFGTPVVSWGQLTEEFDMNKSRRARAQFAEYYGGTPPPPPTGGEMNYGRIKAFTNIRNSPPGGTYQDVGDLQVGTLVLASEIRRVNGYDWWQITDAELNGVTVRTTDGQLMSGRTDTWAYGTNIEITPAPPPPPTSDLPDTWEVTQVAKKDGAVIATYKGTLTKQ